MSAPPGGPSWRGRGGAAGEAGAGAGGAGAGRGVEFASGSGQGAGSSSRGGGAVARGGRGGRGGGSNAQAGDAQLAFWEERRAAWLGRAPAGDAPHTSPPTLTSSAPARPARAQARPPSLLPGLPRFPGLPGQPHPHPGRHRLEQLLSVDNAEADEGIWSSIRQVWQRLTAGTQLTTPLPLGMVVRILRGAWIRDGTWPLTNDGPAQVAEETGEETGNGSQNGGNGHGGNGGYGQGQGALAVPGPVVPLPPVVEEVMEEDGTPTTTTEISEGTVGSVHED